MSDGGWIKLYRRLLEDDLWADCTPIQKTIMVTLLLMANHEEHKWVWKGKKFLASPGQFVTSLPSIQRQAGKGVSIQNVRSALQKFSTCGFLTCEVTAGGRLVTIANWETYQTGATPLSNCLKNQQTQTHQTNSLTNRLNSGESSSAATDSGVDAQATNRPTNRQLTGSLTPNKNKELNTKTLTSKMLAENFEKLWNLYPRKVGKKPAFASYKRAVTRKANPATNKQIQDGIIAYRREVEASGTDKQFVKQGSTFFSQEAWQDYAAIAKQQEAEKPKFDPDQWALDTFSVYGTVSGVIDEIHANGVPVDPERAKQVITEHLESLGRDAASYY